MVATHWSISAGVAFLTSGIGITASLA